MTGLRAPLSWAGGKSQRNGLCEWIAGNLPYTRAYVEPFAGMLAVLLARRRSGVELVNDVDDNVVAFWRAVRDDCDELCRRVEATPASRVDFNAAHAALTDPDTETMERAWALTVCLGQCFTPNLERLTWRQNWATRTSRSLTWSRVPGRVGALADRLAGVVIEHRDALDVLECEVADPRTTIYCDPPYGASAARSAAAFYVAGVDRPAMLDILRGAVAQVAVSGYPGDTWEALEGYGWHRSEMGLLSPMSAMASDGDVALARRVEVLWTNYPPYQATLL